FLALPPTCHVTWDKLRSLPQFPSPSLAFLCAGILVIAFICDVAGLIILLLGIFASLDYWDFFIYSGALLLAFSLVFWIFWYSTHGDPALSYPGRFNQPAHLSALFHQSGEAWLSTLLVKATTQSYLPGVTCSVCACADPTPEAAPWELTRGDALWRDRNAFQTAGRMAVATMCLFTG
uniref:Uncharacterized protein n=1 Tax=Chelonoidis abingdonii TaxID=106734 RepID=A0A8C0J2G1_CHEAB